MGVGKRSNRAGLEGVGRRTWNTKGLELQVVLLHVGNDSVRLYTVPGTSHLTRRPGGI